MKTGNPERGRTKKEKYTKLRNNPLILSFRTLSLSVLHHLGNGIKVEGRGREGEEWGGKGREWEWEWEWEWEKSGGRKTKERK